MNRKPFILQMFGSASSILDLDDVTNLEDSSRVHNLQFIINYQPEYNITLYIVNKMLSVLKIVE